MNNPVKQTKKDTDKIEREAFQRVVGIRVKQFRQQKKWTQEKLAQDAQINDEYVYDIENGIKCMSIWVLEKVANALEVDAVRLLRD